MQDTELVRVTSGPKAVRKPVVQISNCITMFSTRGNGCQRYKIATATNKTFIM